MTADRPYFLTTPIYYVNDLPHLGHAYTTVACDVLARFMRLDGRNVRFLTGTDEHGQKVERSAQARGLTPQQFADGISGAFRDMGRLLNISNDDFIRTTEPRHIRGVQALWRELESRGEIYLGRFAGWYSVRDEAFYDESELIAGPNGTKLAPSGAEVEWLEEENYFFRLSAWQDRLLAWYDAHPDAIAPRSRRNEVISFVRGGLKDLSISRTSFSWGIPVPGDPHHVIYVWLDALVNYITALGYPETQSREFSTFWPADLHMVGKDILRFHTVYWHAFLMAAGLEPPRRVFAHGWWTVEGQKMSKSLGNFIPPDELVDKYGLDPVRYFMLRELPFGSDGDFSHRADGRPAQRRPRQRFRQSGAARAGDDQPQLRRRGARARRVRRSRRAAARRGARSAGPGAAADRRAGFPSRAGDDLAGCRRGQPLCRRAGALGIAAQRSGADGDGALHAGRGAAASRDSGAAFRAGRRRSLLDQLRGARRAPQLLPILARSLPPGPRVAGAARHLPALRRGSDAAAG